MLMVAVIATARRGGRFGLTAPAAAVVMVVAAAVRLFAEFMSAASKGWQSNFAAMNAGCGIQSWQA